MKFHSEDERLSHNFAKLIPHYFWRDHFYDETEKCRTLTEFEISLMEISTIALADFDFFQDKNNELAEIRERAQTFVTMQLKH